MNGYQKQYDLFVSYTSSIEICSSLIEDFSLTEYPLPLEKNQKIMKHLLLLSFLSYAIGSSAQSPIYVDIDATGDNDGSSWDNAYTDLLSAFYVAGTADQIWIADGVYKIDGASESSSYAWFVDSLEIYGGFAGGETSIEDRDWLTNETILSGDIGVEGDDSDNMYTVLYGPLEEDYPVNYSVVDGIVIEGGNSKNVISGPQNSGGGIYLGLFDGTMIYRNCVIRNNRANFGAGVFVSAEYATDLNVVF